MKTTPLLLTAFLLTSSLLVAGKPWRPGLDQLAAESEIIVLGKVTRIEPSLVKDQDGEPCFLAAIHVTETLKGTPPETLLVAMPAAPHYDEKGRQMLISTAYLYDLKQVDHSFVLFLAKPPVADAAYYVPAGSGSGSGIVDLDRNRPGDGPAELERVRAVFGSKMAEPVASKHRYAYRLELIYIAEAAPPEWMFVLSGTGYKTVEALKRGIAGLPDGSVVEIVPRGHPSPNEPLFSSVEDIAALKAFGKSESVEIVEMPGR